MTTRLGSRLGWTVVSGPDLLGLGVQREEQRGQLSACPVCAHSLVRTPACALPCPHSRVRAPVSALPRAHSRVCTPAYALPRAHSCPHSRMRTLPCPHSRVRTLPCPHSRVRTLPCLHSRIRTPTCALSCPHSRVRTLSCPHSRVRTPVSALPPAHSHVHTPVYTLWGERAHRWAQSTEPKSVSGGHHQGSLSGDRHLRGDAEGQEWAGQAD